MAVVNAAVQANLERVVSDEQRRTVVRMAWVRVGISLAATTVIFLVPDDGHATSTTHFGVLIFLGMSVLVLGLTRLLRPDRVWLMSLSVPLLDVPLLAGIQFVQQAALPAMWFGIPTNTSMMCALVVLSGLSLNRAVVWLSAVAAMAGMLVTLLRVPELPAVPIVLSVLMPPAIAAVLGAIISRVRSLIHESRSRDLLGKYVLGERLGVGGMAEVFLATYSPEGGFERKVAVKRILPSFLENRESVALFRREAELGAMLAHPNIVQVLDFGADGETYFLAMELVDGLSLSKLLSFCAQSGLQLPLEACVTLAWSLAEATDYLHTRTNATGTALGLVHRDLNPPNVMISRLGEVKLSDFGIARDQTREQLTAEGVMRGKLGYSAPEQLCGEPFDSRADLFSLGVTLHEALTGRRLFTAETDLALMQATLRNPIAKPSASRPEVPPALDAVVMGLVEREVRQRTQHAREVVNAITAIGAPLFDLARGKKQLAGLVDRAQRERTATPVAASAAAPLPRPSRPSAEAQTATMNIDKPG